MNKKQINEKVKDFFGTTDDFNEVGFILADGTLIDLSGKHVYGTEKLEKQKLEFCFDKDPRWLQKKYEPGVRTIDHSSIDHFMPDGKKMEDFMEECNVVSISGNNRGASSFLWVKIASKPTMEQARIVVEEIRKVNSLWVTHVRTNKIYKKEKPTPLDFQIAISKVTSLADPGKTL